MLHRLTPLFIHSDSRHPKYEILAIRFPGDRWRPLTTSIQFRGEVLPEELRARAVAHLVTKTVGRHGVVFTGMSIDNEFVLTARPPYIVHAWANGPELRYRVHVPVVRLTPLGPITLAPGIEKGRWHDAETLLNPTLTTEPLRLAAQKLFELAKHHRFVER